MLRALVWLRTGDRRKAAAIATTAGVWLGGLLVLAGIVDALATADLIGGLWFMLLGWFLRSAARAEASSQRTADLLSGLTVADVMTLAEGRCDAVPVVSTSGALLGLVTATDVVAAVARGTIPVMAGADS